MKNIIFSLEDINAFVVSILDDTDDIPQTWPQFLLHSTVPTLLNRLNHRSFIDFTHQTISTVQSTRTPSTATLLKRIDDHAIETLIDQIVVKLRKTKL